MKWIIVSIAAPFVLVLIWIAVDRMRGHHRNGYARKSGPPSSWRGRHAR